MRSALPGMGLAQPGVQWGRYPQREESEKIAPRRAFGSTVARWLRADGVGRYAELATRARQQQAIWLELDSSRLNQLTRRHAARMRRDGLTPDHVVTAMACIDEHAHRALGIRFYPSQLICAAALLDQRLAEMATGEGKTYAAGLAAAVSALAGAPVHVLTANEYLAARDCEQLQPLFKALGLQAIDVAYTQSEDERRQRYRNDIVYSTARTVAFDYLRDRLALESAVHDQQSRAQQTQATFLPGLCVAIVDEADGVLIDEAKTPLIISVGYKDPALRAQVWQSLDIAKRLTAEHYQLIAHEHQVVLTAAGRARLEELCHEYGAAWLNRLHREEFTEQALSALYALKKDVDYLVQDGEVVIIDSLTGRAAPGRMWSRGLHCAVALKEGLDTPPATDTQARITYPRLFARYHHLSGLSGTIAEVAPEMRRSYGLDMIRVPLHRPCQREVQALKVFGSRADRDAALVPVLRALVEAKRPVLLTVDTVEQCLSITRLLNEAQLPAVALNAATEADEANIVAKAGKSSVITVATQLAGRGTDIKLSQAVLEAGGLHVLNLQNNRNRRQDRQIAGRAARQGEPGSVQQWLCLDERTLAQWPAWLRSFAYISRQVPSLLPWVVTMAQRHNEREDAQIRRSSLRADRQWARALHFAQINE